MMEQNTNEMLVQVGEENLQDVSGGCTGCMAMTTALMNRSHELATDAIRVGRGTRAGMAANAKSARLDRVIPVALGRSLENRPPIGNGAHHCENFLQTLKDAAPHIH